MKRIFISKTVIALTVIILIISSGFFYWRSRTAPVPGSTSSDPVRDSVGPPCINVDGAVYAMKTSSADLRLSIWEISGFINYNINDLSIVPAEDDQANFNCVFSPYTWVDEELYLYYNGSWHICKPIS